MQAFNVRYRQLVLVAALCGATAASQAAIVITEVAPWSSGNSPVGSDWFEITNTGSVAVNVSGWKFDDNSNSFASSAALNGISTIGAGESVIFIEASGTQTAAGNTAAFKSLWFGANPPAGLQVGSYTGTGIGLSTAGDAVNIFDASGTLLANVVFGASPAGPYASFDNAAGLNNATISQLSVVGFNGAFVAAGDALEIGSPGRVAAVPEASTWALMLLGMVGVTGRIRSRR